MEFSGTLSSKLPNSSNSIFSVMSQMAAEHQAINLSQGFPDFDCDDKLKQLVNHYVQTGGNQYAPMPGLLPLRNVIGKKIFQLYGTNYDIDKEITVVAGATQGLFLAFSSFIKEGDEVIVFEPSYDSYIPGIVVNKGIPVFCRMSADFKIDWNLLEDLICAKTRMIVVNNPHNPSGSVWTEDDVLQLQNLVADKNIIVLSDEVYEHIVFDKKQHQSFARFAQLREHTIIVSSFGKTFHTTGWKVGYVLAPELLMHEYRKVFQFAMFSVVTPIQQSLAEYMKDSTPYMELASFYERKRELLKEYLQKSSFEILPCSGTYFQCLDYRKISNEQDTLFVKKLTQVHKVAAIPLSPFYNGNYKGTIIRLCFAKKDETLHKAGEILCKI